MDGEGLRWGDKKEFRAICLTFLLDRANNQYSEAVAERRQQAVYGAPPPQTALDLSVHQR